MKPVLRLAAAVAFLVLGRHTLAQVQSPSLGNWDNKTVSLQRSSSMCSYIEIVHNRYTIFPSFNGTVTGDHQRVLNRFWNAKLSPDCKMPGATGRREFISRQDSWIFQGQLGPENSQRLSLIASGCEGDCGVGPISALPAQVTIIRDGERLIERDVDETAASVRVFRRAQERETNEREADRAFRTLYQPLLDGECNQFFRLSLDASTSSAVNQSDFCSFAQQVAALTPTVLRDESGFAHGPSLSPLRGLTRQLFLVDGDVVVQRFFVIDPGGGGISIGLVLRKQLDSSWRVLDLLPLMPLP